MAGTVDRLAAAEDNEIAALDSLKVNDLVIDKTKKRVFENALLKQTQINSNNEDNNVRVKFWNALHLNLENQGYTDGFDFAYDNVAISSSIINRFADMPTINETNCKLMKILLI